MTDRVIGRQFDRDGIQLVVRTMLEDMYAEELGGGLAPREAVDQLVDQVAADFSRRLSGVHASLRWTAKKGVRRTDGVEKGLPRSEKQLKRMLMRSVEEVLDRASVDAMEPFFKEAQTVVNVTGEEGPAVLVPRPFSFEVHPHVYGQNLAREMHRFVAGWLKGRLDEGPELYSVVNARRINDQAFITRVFDLVGDPDAGAAAKRAYDNFVRALFPSML